MKIIFAHDHRFLPLDDQIFSEVQFDSHFWDRYLTHFEQVIVTARKGDLPKNKTKENLILSDHQNVSFKFLPNLSNLKNQLLQRSQAIKLFHESLKESDGVIARLPSEIGLLAIECAIAKEKPWAVEVVGCPWDVLVNYGKLQGKLYAPILTWRMKQAVAKSPFTLYVTDKFLQKRYPCFQGETINCSDVEIFPPSVAVLEQRLERIKNNERKKIRLGLIGTLKGKHKGIETVLIALKQFRSQLPPFEFRVLGGGDVAPWGKLAQSLEVDDVTFFDGTLPVGEPVFQWLDQIDIYLQPSFQEGLPRALIEAMSRGCPAIASCVAGIPELLDKSNLIAPGNVSSLGELLIKVSYDHDWFIEQAKKNWQKATNYSSHILDMRRNNFWQRFKDHIVQSTINNN